MAETKGEQTKVPNRYVILAAATVCAMGCGAIYMWSIFNSPLMVMFDYSPSAVSLAYSAFLLFTCLAQFLSGWLQKRVEFRFIVLGSGILFGLGWFLTGFATTLPMLYFAFGCLAGAGNGLLSNLVLSISAKWFPDHRGVANGICIGAIGIGPAMLAPAGNALIESFDVLMAFRIVGIFWIVVYGSLSWLLKLPPEGWAPKGWDPSQDGVVMQSAHEYTTKEMLRTPAYWVLLALLMTASASGYLASGQASGIAQLQVGLTPSMAALMVSVLALGSFAGRFGFGTLSDFIGRLNALIVGLVITVIIMLIFLDDAHDFATLLVCLCLVGAGFGGTFTLIPSITADLFGSKNFGLNYAFVFPGATIACFVGPTLAAQTLEWTGVYDAAFLFVGAMGCIAIVLALILKRLSRSVVK